MWLALGIISIILIASELFALRKRIQSIEDGRGPGYSQAFRINAGEAIMYSKMVKDDLKIKSLNEGKAYKDFDKNEKSQYAKVYREVLKKASVWIVYLVGDNVFISTPEGSEKPTISKPGGDYIYSATVYGDMDGFKDHLDLTIERRIIEKNGKHEWVVTAYFQEIPGISLHNAKTTMLFDFPFTSINETDETMKQRGFEIKKEGGDDVYTDALGETHGIPSMETFSQNRASIFYSH